MCDPLVLRALLIDYLRKRYSSHLICEQHKAILLCGEGRRVRADIVVLIPQLWQHAICLQCGKPQCSHGYELRSSRHVQFRIATWPEQHRDNAAAYDLQTGGRYKRTVRAAKAMLRSDVTGFPDLFTRIPSILIENLFARLPPDTYATVNACPYHLVTRVLDNLCLEFHRGRARYFQELSDKRSLFDSAQTWTYEQVQSDLFRMRSLL